MKSSEWLRTSEAKLVAANVSTAHLDCLVLLEDETGKDRAWLLSHPEHELQRSEIEILNTKIVQRAQHVPLAYIRGKAEFYGREFAVNEHILVPRPETETMIDMLKVLVIPASEPESINNWIPDQVRDDKLRVLDIGTGSGAIGITAKLELPMLRVIATDIDKECLKIAKLNAKKLGADIQFLQGNLLQPLATNDSPLDTILLCNLPYVPDDFAINAAATHEPKHAIFAGPDGLDLYRKLFEQIAHNDWKPTFILTESMPPQHAKLAKIAKVADFTLTKTDDFIQLFTPGT